MKLYTEEQVRKVMYKAMYLSHCNLEDLTPIELPTDEEIEEKCNSLDGYEFDSHDSAFFGGAKWMLDKIKGGNNE